MEKKRDRKPHRSNKKIAKSSDSFRQLSNLQDEFKQLLTKHELPHLWKEEILKQVDDIDMKVKVTADRRDIRHLPLVTIDGEDAQDFDDALYAKATNSGWTLVVAIADVAHYVLKDSPIDAEAQNRGTSSYFPHCVVPMLPEKLSNHLCSLLPNEERYSLAVEMQIDQHGNIVEYQFFQAVICSSARLTYLQVEQYINQQQKNTDKEHQIDELIIKDVAQSLSCLLDVFMVLLEQRNARNALDFDVVEIQIILNEKQQVKTIGTQTRLTAHRLVEEAMLAANNCAADFLLSKEIPCLFRNHASPSAEKLTALRGYLTKHGLALGGGDNPTPDHFQHLIHSASHINDKNIFYNMLLRAQQQARYAPDNQGHFGLALEKYTHFTSPIRRYPDLLVHRAIRSTLQGPQYLYNMDDIGAMGELCSHHERRAEEASREMIQWFKCEYLKGFIGETYTGKISTVVYFGVFVLLDELMVEGLVHVSNLSNDYYVYDEVNQSLQGRSTKRVFNMGDTVDVTIAGVNSELRRVDFQVTTSKGSDNRKRHHKKSTYKKQTKKKAFENKNKI